MYLLTGFDKAITFVVLLSVVIMCAISTVVLCIIKRQTKPMKEFLPFAKDTLCNYIDKCGEIKDVI